MSGLFAEMKRRNVVRVGIAYVVVAWLILQFADLVLENINAPDWVMQSIMLVLAIGFPLILLFAWAFEITPEGLKTTKEVDRSESVTHNTGRKLDRMIIAVLVVALGYFIWDGRQPNEATTPSAETIAITAPETSTTAPVTETGEITETGTIRRSIAVLPFVNMSSDEEQEWFADGLTEEILNSLARTPDLLVSARTSSFAYKDSEEDVPAIAMALGVDHILEGSVRRSGDRLRVTAQLIRANDGFHLWSQNYDRDVADMIDIQENVAFEIARALKTAIDPDELANFVASGTNSIPAYEAMLKGQAIAAEIGDDGDQYLYLEAKQSYDEAVEIDPEYSEAHFQLARFWAIQLDESLQVAGLTDLSADEILLEFEKAIQSAIQSEEDAATKTYYRAVALTTQNRLKRAAKLFADYLELRPNDQRAHVDYVIALSELGRLDEVKDVIFSLQEQFGYNGFLTNTSITTLLYVNDNEALERFTNTALDRFPDSVTMSYQAHRAYLWSGDIDAASQLQPAILASDMGEGSRFLVRLRQLCAENDISGALAVYERDIDKFVEDPSWFWLANKIMGYDDIAHEYLMNFDAMGKTSTVASFLNYHHFDPRQYPNLMQAFDNELDGRGPVQTLPYRCNLPEQQALNN